ncbi:MAG: ABC transporter permease [Candidatus Omnitrophica bacterium]|nr:ABC transporter permease [Candidatus Omnitrophota bacterium]
MPKNDAAVTEFKEETPHVSEFRRIAKIFLGRKIVVFGLVIILLTIICAIFAPWIAPYDPYELDMTHPVMSPSWQHLLGTDSLGRDILSRIIFGTRTSLLVGIIAVGIASLTGMTLGLLAGYFSGWVHMLIMRFTDSLMAVPMILLALVMATLLGGGLKNVMIALGIGMMAVYTRLMCAQVLAVKENDYIMAQKAIGASNIRIILRHILPNCFPPLIVLVTLMMGSAILAEAGLSFLGIGLEPGNTAWGAMVSDGYQHLLTTPVLSFAPGMAIMLLVFAFNMVGDGLRDALDPKLRGAF